MYLVPDLVMSSPHCMDLCLHGNWKKIHKGRSKNRWENVGWNVLKIFTDVDRGTEVCIRNTWNQFNADSSQRYNIIRQWSCFTIVPVFLNLTQFEDKMLHDCHDHITCAEHEMLWSFRNGNADVRLCVSCANFGSWHSYELETLRTPRIHNAGSRQITLLKSDVTRRDHVVRCHGSHECWFTHRQCHSQFHSRWHSLRITLKSTTLVCMRRSNAWTTKSWQRSEWRLGFNSVYIGS